MNSEPVVKCSLCDTPAIAGLGDGSVSWCEVHIDEGAHMVGIAVITIGEYTLVRYQPKERADV